MYVSQKNWLDCSHILPFSDGHGRRAVCPSKSVNEHDSRRQVFQLHYNVHVISKTGLLHAL